MDGYSYNQITRDRDNEAEYHVNIKLQSVCLLLELHHGGRSINSISTPQNIMRVSGFKCITVNINNGRFVFCNPPSF